MIPAGAGLFTDLRLGVIVYVTVVLSLFAFSGSAFAASLETTVTPTIDGSVPVSLDETSCARIAAALHGLSVEATVTALPASDSATVTVEGTLPVVWAGISGVADPAFQGLLVLLGAVLGAGAFYLLVRVWGGRD